MHLTAAQDAKETWLVDDEVGCEAENSRKKRSLTSIASLSQQPYLIYFSLVFTLWLSIKPG